MSHNFSKVPNEGLAQVGPGNKVQCVEASNVRAHEPMSAPQSHFWARVGMLSTGQLHGCISHLIGLTLYCLCLEIPNNFEQGILHFHSA